MSGIDDLKKLKGYFDKTLVKMGAKIQEQELNIDITQYDAFAKTWHEICDKSLQLVTTGERDLTEEQTSVKCNQLLTHYCNQLLTHLRPIKS